MEQTRADYIEHVYVKSTSWRIYGKLYKYIDLSDMLSYILPVDARDPLDTLCERVLEYIRKENAHNQNHKYNLIPNWVTVCHLPIGNLAILTPSSPYSQLFLICEMSVPYILAHS